MCVCFCMFVRPMFYIEVVEDVDQHKILLYTFFFNRSIHNDEVRLEKDHLNFLGGSCNLTLPMTVTVPLRLNFQG